MAGSSPSAGTSAPNNVPLRAMADWILKTPTLLTSNATLPTPATIVDAVFTYNRVAMKWTNAAGTEVASPYPTVESGRSIVHGLSGGIPELMFWGRGASNDTFTAIVVLSALIRNPADHDKVQLVRRAATSALTLTLGTRTGVAGGLLTTDDRYVDTIANAAERGLSPLGTRVVGPTVADDGQVTLLCPDPLGESWLEVFIKTGSSVTGVGIAVRENSGGG